MLDAPITEEGLTNVTYALAKGKRPSLSRLTVDFFKADWSFISTNFTTTMNTSMRRNWFSNGVPRSLISLLFKEGDRLKLAKWQPITLFNTTYKIFLPKLWKGAFFLKLDFTKAYDRVHWSIMFQVIEKLGMPNPFIYII